MIRSEGGKLVGFVFVDTDRPIADYVADARAAVVHRSRAAGGDAPRLGRPVPVLRARPRTPQMGDPADARYRRVAALSQHDVPRRNGHGASRSAVSLVGAVWLVYLLHYNVSVAVWVGVIALAGLDAETGVVMLLYLTLAHRRRAPVTPDDLRETIVEGAAKRLPPPS